jgi:tRNA dimethylallyltransferase
LAWIRGQVSLEQASQTWFRKTRAYAKRQLTWFRKEPKVYWLSGADQGAALELIKDWP